MHAPDTVAHLAVSTNDRGQTIGAPERRAFEKGGRAHAVGKGGRGAGRGGVRCSDRVPGGEKMLE